MKKTKKLIIFIPLLFVIIGSETDTPVWAQEASTTKQDDVPSFPTKTAPRPAQDSSPSAPFPVQVQNLSVPPQITLPPENRLTRVCSEATLTGEKFLDLYYAVAMHGDLADLSFIEKTFGVKLIAQHSEVEDGRGGTYRSAVYKSVATADMPMTIFVSMQEDAKNQPIYDKGLRMIFSAPFLDCFKISGSTFSEKFGGNFSGGLGTDSSVLMGAAKTLKGVGKHGTEISVGYQYDVRDKIVDHVTIIQRP